MKSCIFRGDNYDYVVRPDGVQLVPYLPRSTGSKPTWLVTGYYYQQAIARGELVLGAAC